MTKTLERVMWKKKTKFALLKDSPFSKRSAIISFKLKLLRWFNIYPHFSLPESKGSREAQTWKPFLWFWCRPVPGFLSGPERLSGQVCCSWPSLDCDFWGQGVSLCPQGLGHSKRSVRVLCRVRISDNGSSPVHHLIYNVLIWNNFSWTCPFHEHVHFEKSRSHQRSLHSHSTLVGGGLRSRCWC